MISGAAPAGREPALSHASGVAEASGGALDKASATACFRGYGKAVRLPLYHKRKPD
jgi:hypothetical protein